jgi:hypothetical protein
MDWVTVDETRVLGALSASQLQLYQGWIVQYPAKATRVAEIIANLVMEFRAAIEANPQNYLDPDLAKLPQSCVRYCETLILFDLCSEMGASISEADIMAIGKAEVFLRLMFSGRFYITGGDGSNAPSPSYETGVERDVRTVDG